MRALESPLDSSMVVTVSCWPLCRGQHEVRELDMMHDVLSTALEWPFVVLYLEEFFAESYPNQTQQQAPEFNTSKASTAIHAFPYVHLSSNHI